MFLVGAERTAIILHKTLPSVTIHHRIGRPYGRGAMSEAKACQAEMLDTDIITFVRFSQWLYIRDYDIPYCDGRSQMLISVKCKSLEQP